jgi:hypothetical protein
MVVKHIEGTQYIKNGRIIYQMNNIYKNGSKIYQMKTIYKKIYQWAVKYSKWHYVNLQTIYISKPTKGYQNWDFWYANIPSESYY